MDQQRIDTTNAVFVPQVRRLIEEGRTVRFRANGWSMRPMIEHARDEVLLVPYGKREPAVYDVVLAETAEGFFVLHRIMRIKNHIYELQGDGNAKQREHCPRSGIIARAEAFYRKGNTRPILTDGTLWRCYSRIWVALLPLRRWLLAIHRRLIRFT